MKVGDLVKWSQPSRGYENCTAIVVNIVKNRVTIMWSDDIIRIYPDHGLLRVVNESR